MLGTLTDINWARRLGPHVSQSKKKPEPAPWNQAKDRAEHHFEVSRSSLSRPVWLVDSGLNYKKKKKRKREISRVPYKNKRKKREKNRVGPVRARKKLVLFYSSQTRTLSFNSRPTRVDSLSLIALYTKKPTDGTFSKSRENWIILVVLIVNNFQSRLTLTGCSMAALYEWGLGLNSQFWKLKWPPYTK